MVQNIGNALAHTATGHRPLPLATGHVYRQPHAQHAPKRGGFDWDWNKTPCTGCGIKTAKPQLVDGVCPACRGNEQPAGPAPVVEVDEKGSTYPVLSDVEVEERFTAPARPTPQTPAALASPRVPAPRGQAPSPRSPGLGGKRPAADAEGEAARQPATTNHHARETTVISPPFPTYIVDIAIVMRDSENHPNPAVRAARKAVANALVGLNRELTRVGSPAASTRPDPLLGSARASKLDPVRDQVIADYQAGHSAVVLGRKYGVSDVAIRSFLERNGIRLRTRSEAQKARPTTTAGGTR